jgi:ribosome assembly protein YihI (activator of Der GTPase)
MSTDGSSSRFKRVRGVISGCRTSAGTSSGERGEDIRAGSPSALPLTVDSEQLGKKQGILRLSF